MKTHRHHQRGSAAPDGENTAHLTRELFTINYSLLIKVRSGIPPCGHAQWVTID